MGGTIHGIWGLVCCQVIGKEERGVELPAQKNLLEGEED